MGVTLPTGSLVDGCYDEVGNLYRLPEVVVSDPANMGRGSDGEELTVHRSRNSNNIDGETMIGVAEPKITASAEGKVLCGEEGGMETDDHGFLERRREEKGKESERDALKVRCRLSDRGGPDVVITLGKTQHVGSLAKKVQTEGNVGHSLSWLCFMSLSALAASSAGRYCGPDLSFSHLLPRRSHPPSASA